MACRKRNRENMDEVPGKVPAKNCQPCSRKNDNNIANIFCVDCEEYQCNECSKVHQHFPVMATHKLIHATDAEYVSAKYDMKGLDRCTQHRKLVEFLCEDDNKLCCSTCAIVNHRKCHSVVEIEEKAKAENPGLTSLKTDLCDTDSKNRDFYQRVLNTRQRLATDESAILNSIKDMQDNVHTMFERLKTEVSRDIVAFKDQTMKKLDTSETSSCNIASEIKLHFSDIQDVARQGTPVQQLIISRHLKAQVRQLQQKIQKHTEEFEDIEMSFKFDDFLTLPPNKITIPGKLTMRYVTMTEQDCKEKKQKKEQEDQKVNLKLLRAINLKQGKGDKKKPFITGMDFLRDGRLVVVDNANTKCIVYDYRLKELDSCRLSFLPLSLVSISNNKVAVTTGKERELIFLKISNTHKVTGDRYITVNHDFDSITVKEQGKLLVGTFDDPLPVRVLSLSGQETDVGIKFPTNTYHADHSCCTYIKNCNKIVLTDRYAHIVYIFDIDSNTRIDVKDIKIIKEPYRVVVGPSDVLFVCCIGTNSIVQISHTGQILSSLVMDMKYPFSVCVSKEKTKLAVSNSDSGNCKLQLYRLGR